jgi:hypothetical protein
MASQDPDYQTNQAITPELSTQMLPGTFPATSTSN